MIARRDTNPQIHQQEACTVMAAIPDSGRNQATPRTGRARLVGE